MKRLKRTVAFLLSFAMIMGMAAVTTTNVADAAKVTVKSVKVNTPYEKKAYVVKGKTIKLSANVTVAPNKSANKTVTYTSKNKSIVTVDAKGSVKGKKVGTTKVVIASKKNKNKKATITVQVVKTAVTAVKLDKKSASVNMGESISLKATVSAKSGANKSLYWKTSNAKVATVSQKGAVNAVGAGSATITAMAADGSKKKAACKVTVNNSISIKNMDVVNSQSITFSLDRAHAVNASQIVVKKKLYENGTYNNALAIDSVVTTDNVNYTIILSSDTTVSVDQYVQLSIPSLPGSGTKVIEKIYTEPATAYAGELIYTATVNKPFKVEYTYYGTGYSSYSVTNLPAGLIYEVKNDTIYFKGTPTTPGVAVATLVATDETGNTKTQKVTFCIGSPEVIAAAASEIFELKGADGVDIDKYIHVTGGSGNYTFTKVPDATGLTAYNGYVEGSIQLAGDYQVVINIADKKNPAITTSVTLTIHIAQGNTVTGIVTDAAGTAMNGSSYSSSDRVSVTFTNKNKADRYLTGKTIRVEADGSYSVVLPSGNFDIRVNHNYSDTTRYIYNQSITTTGPLANFSLPLYKVILVPPEGGMTGIHGSYWYDDDFNDNSVGYGNAIYLKSGTYAIHTSTDYSTWYSSTFTVGATAIQVAMTKNEKAD